jgi:hypothetical protein
LDFDVKATGAWLAPDTETAAREVFETTFDAFKPVAELEPEAADVVPVERGAGPVRATLTPDFELAALESWIELECWLSTDSVPSPPPATPALSWVLFVLVWARPAEAMLDPLRALIADCGVCGWVGALAAVAGITGAAAVAGNADGTGDGEAVALAAEPRLAAVADATVDDAEVVGRCSGLAAVVEAAVGEVAAAGETVLAAAVVAEVAGGEEAAAGEAAELVRCCSG